jgi:hypothetical protein
LSVQSTDMKAFNLDDYLNNLGSIQVKKETLLVGLRIKVYLIATFQIVNQFYTKMVEHLII